MSLLWTLFLAVMQGLTEFLPVSSSAHLTIVGYLAGIREEDALVFFVVLHVGTLGAVLAYFWRELWALLAGLVRGERGAWRFALLVLTTTLPTGVIGIAIKPLVEKMVVSPAAAGCFLFVTAGFLFATRWMKDGTKGDADITFLDALLVGVAQGFAVFPGVSRSGATLAAALARGLDRETAFRYSFLASLPAVAGAFLMEGRHAVSSTNPHLADDLLGLTVAFAVGLIALVIVRGSLVKRVYHHFAWWCLAAGAFGIWLGISG